MPDLAHQYEKQNVWNQHKLLNSIKDLTSETIFKALENEGIRSKNTKTLKKILRKTIESINKKPKTEKRQNRKEVTVATANLNQVGDNTTKIKEALEWTQADILCVQETEIKRKRKHKELPKIPGYKWITRNTKNGGTAILIDTTTVPLNICKKLRHPNDHSCAIEIKSERRTIRIINVYLPVSIGNKNKRAHKKSLDTLRQHISRNCIIMGDFNGWISTYNNGKSNDHGTHIEDFTNENYLQIEPLKKIRERATTTTIMEPQ